MPEATNIGIWSLDLVQNASFSCTFVTDVPFASITTARMEIRETDSPTSTLYLSRTVGDGLTLTDASGLLTVGLSISETDVDTLCAAMEVDGAQFAHSLKLTYVGGNTIQLLKGIVSHIHTPTA